MRMRLKTAASAIAISTAFLTQNVAAQTERIRFEIEAKPVSQALQEFAVQSGYQMAFLANAADGARARSVSGTLSPQEALQRLLDGTGLEFRVIDERTIAILQRTAEADGEGRSGEASLQYASAREELQQTAALQEVAQAQTQTAQAQTQIAADASGEIEEIVVTGSRLAGTNLTSPVPVFQIGSEEINIRGAIRVEDILNVMPQVVTSQTSEVGNGATGTSNVDLRGLGAIRTLVLVDGKRLPFGSPQSAPANLDIVPTQLVERVDVVTGGASAVYGADAVAGVVNFILKDDFEGIEVDTQVGFHQTGNDRDFLESVFAAGQPGGGVTDPDSTTDGREVFASVTLGANSADDKGNVTAFLSYQNQNMILNGARDHSACAILPTSSPISFQGIGCVGSSNFRRFTTEDGTEFFQQEDGTLKPFEGGPTESFNFEQIDNLQRPVERFNINALAHYDITDSIEIYSDLSFMNNDTTAQIANSATFNRPFQVNCDNPLLDDAPRGEVGNVFDIFGCSEALEAIANGAPNPVTGELNSVDIPFTNAFVIEPPVGNPRRFNFDITTWRVALGFRGQIAEHFDWDIYGQFSRTNSTETTTGDLNFDKVQEALFVVDDGSGNAVCRSGNSRCVPFNIFDRTDDGETLITPEAVNFIEGVGIVEGMTEQQIVSGTIQGNLGRFGFKSPGAERGVSALIGVEYREDTLKVNPDDVSNRPGGTGFTGSGGGELPVDGRLEVVELFMETEIPLIENVPFFESWSLNGAYRRSEYDTDGLNSVTGERVKNDFSTDTWFVGTTWSPTPDVRLRAQFQRAIRAPNVIELFTGLNTGLFNLAGDPCAGPAPDATLEACMRTGVTAQQFGNIPQQPAQQFNQVTGGNPELEPEIADTITIGGVFTPSFFPGLSLSVDYFNIEIEDTIDTIPPQTTLFRCLESGNPQFCDLIVRDRFGSLFVDSSNFEGIQATNVNIATLETSGVDFSLVYDLSLSDLGLENAGSINFDYAGTWTTEFEEVPIPGGEIIDCQGKFAGQCDTPQPEYKHRFLATWNTPWKLQATATWRHFGDTEFQGVARHPLNEKLETQDYIDFVLRYQVTDNVRVRLGVNNLFDNSPPITSREPTTTGNGNTFPGVFDPDRFIFFGLNFTL